MQCLSFGAEVPISDRGMAGVGRDTVGHMGYLAVLSQTESPV